MKQFDDFLQVVVVPSIGTGMTGLSIVISPEMICPTPKWHPLLVEVNAWLHQVSIFNFLYFAITKI